MNRTGFAAAACIMLLILGTCFFYVGRKIYRLLYLAFPGINAQIFIGIVIFFFLSAAMGFMPLGHDLKKIFIYLAWLLMGLFVYLLMYFLIADIILLFGRLFKAIPSPVPFRITLIAGICVLGLAFLSAVYGIYNANRIKTASYSVQVEKESALKELKIVLIADLHLWYVNDNKWLARIIKEINSQKPDIVCIAGDIFNDNLGAIKNPQEAIRLLQSINSVYGVYACLGNHDGGTTFDEMLEFLEKGNVKVLLDEFITIENLFIVLGRRESSPIGNQGERRKEISVAAQGINENFQEAPLPVIVLDHNPANIKEYDGKFDLVLSGHTHRGQVIPGNIITNLMYEADYGYYRKDENSPHVVVTSGAGIWGPPLRIGTNNEIASIVVSFKN